MADIETQHRARINELESELQKQRLQQVTSQNGNNLLHAATGRPASTRDEAYRVLLSKIPEAFNAGLKRDAEESRALSRHMQRIEKCEAEHYNACKQLREEVRAELTDEFKESGLRTSLAKA